MGIMTESWGEERETANGECDVMAERDPKRQM